MNWLSDLYTIIHHILVYNVQLSHNVFNNRISFSIRIGHHHLENVLCA